MWKVYGEELFTNNFTGGNVFYQPFTLPRDIVLHAIRSQIVVYGDPDFSSIYLRIMTNRSGLPMSTIYQSIAVTKEDIYSLPYAIKEVPFLFAARPMLKGGDTYHAVIWVNDYTGDANSHLAWKRSWPDPVNSTNFTATIENIAVAPFHLAFIGGDP